MMVVVVVVNWSDDAVIVRLAHDAGSNDAVVVGLAHDAARRVRYVRRRLDDVMSGGKAA